MKIYTLKKEQFLPITLEEAWDFLSSPSNLKTITPEYMGFDIVSGETGKMYSGQIIHYIVRPVMGLPMNWTTEIKHVDAPYYFVDEQRNGPYKMWYHQHRIRETEGGVIMEDEVSYALPLGFLGRIAHSLFVRKQLEGIFSYRTKVLEERFGQAQVMEEVVSSLTS